MKTTLANVLATNGGLPPATGAILVILGLIVHAMYVKDHLSHNRVSNSLLSSSRMSIAEGTSDYIPPPLFIYRRTKKSGSSSMLAVLLPQLRPMGYKALYFHRGEMEVAVRNEYVREHPQHLFIAEHNRITRMHHPRRLGIIADTIRDGYDQMTSFCRYVKKVKTCDKEIAECLRTPSSLAQNYYRWANREEEDSDTYIDLPLSSAHPALSTTVIRTVFPNITLDLREQYNRKHSTCPERRVIRAVYDELYKPLDEQILRLKRRILVLAGYPYLVHDNFKANITIDQIMGAAEELELDKYPQLSMMPSRSSKRKSGYSKVHEQLRSMKSQWYFDGEGHLSIRSSGTKKA